MDKLLDYVKYTIALAIGLLVYLPANFLPTESSAHHWIIGLTVGGLGLSALAGILMYTRATKLILEGKSADDKNWMRIWGNTHFLLLAICYCFGAYYFVVQKIIAPTPSAECQAELVQPDGSKAIITFACKGAAKTN